MKLWRLIILLVLAASAHAREQYDLLLKGGHFIDPRNKLSAIRDLAIRDRKVAAVAPNIDAATAYKTVDVKGLYITPGLVDIHVHIFASTGERNSYAGERSVYPDDMTLRCGVTTVADAGSSGWRNFPVFRETIIARSRTRIFAFLNIVGHGMRGQLFERELADMEPGPTSEMALKHKGVIVGIKTAHYMGRDFAAVDRAVEAGKVADIPVMVDFGRVSPQKTLAELVTKKLRPGDIYTHVYSGLRGELDPAGHANPALFEGRKRGVIFDVGHGFGQLHLACRGPDHPGRLPARLHLDRHALGQLYLEHERHAQRHEQIPGPRVAARGSDPPLHLEPCA